jgi:hypothetical protein
MNKVVSKSRELQQGLNRWRAFIERNFAVIAYDLQLCFGRESSFGSIPPRIHMPTNMVEQTFECDR